MTSLLRIPVTLLLISLLACNCATISQQSPSLDDVQHMLDSTVQIEVRISATIHSPTGDQQVESGWLGSGVVYGKTDGFTGPVESDILSAHHVMDVPAVNSDVLTEIGLAHIDAVLMVVRTNTGRTCELTPKVLGNYETGDVATGVAHCDAGRVALIATRSAPRGAKVIVTGHPLGVWPAMTTEGYVAGWNHGFLMLSCPAFHGNSGGPIWYNGEVIGLLVRGSEEYTSLTLGTPLQAIVDRIDGKSGKL